MYIYNQRQNPREFSRGMNGVASNNMDFSNFCLEFRIIEYQK
jgi:hypothetical protein